MKRRISLFMAVLLIICNVFCVSGCKKNEGNESGKSVSQGEWLAMLNEKFGMYTYKSSTPYYDEVDMANKYFGAVQIAYEWDIIDEETKLAVDEPVTKAFAAETLVRAVGHKDVKDMSGEEITQLAADEGYIDFEYRGRTDNGRRITETEAQNSLDSAKDIWTNPDYGAAQDNSEYTENVVDLSNNDLGNYYEEDGKIYIPEEKITKEEIEDIKNGEVYILPGMDGISTEEPHKAEKVEQSEGYVVIENSAEELTQEEVYKEFVASGSVTPSLTDYPITDGVGNVLLSQKAVEQTAYRRGENRINNLEYAKGDPKIELLDKKSVSVSADSEGVSLNFETDGLKVSGTITGNKVAFAVSGDILSDNGGKITVGKSYEISDVSLDYDMDCKFLDLKNSRIFAQLNYTTKDTTTLGVSYNKTVVAAPEYTNGNGKFPSNFKRSIMKDSQAKGAKSIKIATIPVFTNGGLRIDLDIRIKISVSGEVSLEVTTNNIKGIEYKNGSIRYINDSQTSTELSIKGKLEVTGYLGVSFRVLNQVIAGLGVESGIGGKVDIVVHLIDENRHLLDEVRFEDTNADAVQEEAALLNGTSYQHDSYGNIVVSCENCVDLTVYGIVRIGVDSASVLGSILNSSDIKTEIELIGEKNGKIPEWSGHWENGVKVSECTRQYKGEDEEEKTETQKETHTDVDQRLDVDVYFMNILQGEAVKLQISQMPDGYSKESLVWEIGNSEVAVIGQDGTITGVSTGITVVTVKTSDGKYKAQCTISVGGGTYS